MSELFINKAKALAVTGHRILAENFDYKELYNTLEKFINKDFDTFLIGMAIGFDSVCFATLEKLKEKYPFIKLIACIPCLSQSCKFTQAQKEEYDRMLSVADEKIVLGQEYTPTCMQKRNKFMVDNASVVLAYMYKNYGGTANTVNYAKKNNVPIYYVKGSIIENN